MTFLIEDKYDIPELQDITTPNGRIYVTPEGKRYPSVTTVLGALPKPQLDAWKKREGDNANKIVAQASARGSDLHLCLEKYIQGADWKKGFMPETVYLAKTIQPYLDKYLGTVVKQECPLYSDFLLTAGRVDLVAYWKGKLSIIDFKNSRKEKKREYIKNYFMQESFYAVAFEERTGKPIRNLVTIIAHDESQIPQIFEESRDDHIHDFIRAREYFTKTNTVLEVNNE